MRRRFDTIETVALVSACTLLGTTAVGAAPRRPSIPMPRWSAGNVASPEARRVGQCLQEAAHEWQEVKALTTSSNVSGDFIFDMVAPESLALAPATAEYDATYALEWDDEEHPALDMDDVDLEIFSLHAADA